MTGPFGDDRILHSGSVATLAKWLAENTNHSIVIASGYTVGDLINDLNGIAAGIWHDGVDAMGEDA